jgi:predicted DNA-binding transcriptional regulator AlpA
MKTLRVGAVAEKIGVSVPSIWRFIHEQEFPRPFKLGPNTSVWDEADIDRWLHHKKEKHHNENH